MHMNVTNVKRSVVDDSVIHNVAIAYKCDVCEKHVLNLSMNVFKAVLFPLLGANLKSNIPLY
jgi:hypothetical protein